jgi:hypothetical protein
MRDTTCLANQWAVVRETGSIELVAKRSPGARQIYEAEYDPVSERVFVVFVGGTSQQVKL